MLSASPHQTQKYEWCLLCPIIRTFDIYKKVVKNQHVTFFGGHTVQEETGGNMCLGSLYYSNLIVFRLKVNNAGE